MLYDRIDHIILAVASVDEAAALFERLGLTLTPVARHVGRGTENRVFFTGGPESEFYVELLGIANVDEARRALGDTAVQACAENRGLIGVVLNVPSMDDALTSLAARGLARSAFEVFAEDGRKVCDAAEIGEATRAVADLRLIQYPEDGPARHARHGEAGLFDHTFPLRRLDHLAAIAPDLEAVTRFWTETLDIPVWGEVRTPAIVIRQMRIGDAILELLGPATPDSPAAARPPGLISMAAFEVPDLDAAVAQARAAGFTPSEPATGVLPGTRTATISAAELSGLALQLLEYV